MNQLNNDELIQKLLNTKNEAEYFKTVKSRAGKISLLATKEEHLAQKEGRLTLEDVTIPGYGRAHLLKEQFQGIVGPNHLWYFTVNVGRVMQNCRFTGADLAVWNKILQNMWYYNYICIRQGQYAKSLELSEKTVSETFKKFRENFIIESVAPEQKIPKEVAGYKGTWFRVSTDMVWLGPVWALEKPPENYTIIRRKKNPEQKTLLESFMEMRQKNRLPVL